MTRRPLVYRVNPHVLQREAAATTAQIVCPWCKEQACTFTVGATRESLHYYHVLLCHKAPPEAHQSAADYFADLAYV